MSNSIDSIRSIYNIYWQNYSPKMQDITSQLGNIESIYSTYWKNYRTKTEEPAPSNDIKSIYSVYWKSYTTKVEDVSIDDLVSIYSIYWNNYKAKTNTDDIENIYLAYWNKYNPKQIEGDNNLDIDSIYSVYWDKYHPKTDSNNTSDITSIYTVYYNKYTQQDNNKTISGKKKLEGSVEVHELRNTPGFTNYVTSIQKNNLGVVSSAELKRYYSNIDAEVYFNGQWVEDISQIQWTINQQTTPLFGFNSFIWDDVAQGSRIIQGSFSILFTKPEPVYDYVDKEGKYINSIKEYQATMNNSYENTISQLKKTTVRITQNGGKYTSNLDYRHAPRWGKNFDIDIVCGEYEEIGGYPVHIILKECYITNCMTMRTKDGEPATEMYQFMAKDYETIK